MIKNNFKSLEKCKKCILVKRPKPQKESPNSSLDKRQISKSMIEKHSLQNTNRENLWLNKLKKIINILYECITGNRDNT